MRIVDAKRATVYFFMIIFWGSAFAGIRIGLKGYSPEHLSLLRLLVGSVGLLFYAFWKRMPLPKIKDVPIFLLLGCFGFAFYQIALNIGEKTVSAGTASLLVSCSPMFVALFSSIFYQEKQEKQIWIGGIIALFGIAFISFGTEYGFSIGIGAIFILLASASESLFFVFQGHFIKKYGFLPFTAYTIWGATICTLIYFPGLGEEILQAPLQSSLSAAYLGIGPTVLAYLALSYISSKTEATEAASSFYLIPLTAFLIAWLLLGERPNMITISGGVLTLMGVLITH
jgi:drug/metabolite transporter (DMT)-like permease